MKGLWSRETLERKESAAVTLLEIMDKGKLLPPLRIESKDWAWLSRNIGIDYSDHPLFYTVYSLIDDILQEKQTGSSDDG